MRILWNTFCYKRNGRTGGIGQQAETPGIQRSGGDDDGVYSYNANSWKWQRWFCCLASRWVVVRTWRRGGGGKGRNYFSCCINSSLGLSTDGPSSWRVAVTGALVVVLLLVVILEYEIPIGANLVTHIPSVWWNIIFEWLWLSVRPCWWQWHQRGLWQQWGMMLIGMAITCNS